MTSDDEAAKKDIERDISSILNQLYVYRDNPPLSSTVSPVIAESVIKQLEAALILTRYSLWK